MTDEARKRLLDVMNACDAIAGFVEGKDFAVYQQSKLLRSAVERQFEIVGEALNKAAVAEPQLGSEIPDLHRIVGLRNRLIHGYDNVDDEILWDVVQTKLAPLRLQAAAAMRDPGP
ncbi:MAG: DUF86 domain-containing protein [Verrucomicrobiota bacterium]|nr:DUF86 domain-containing protein [Verrucomicrobiota bacterium]